MFLNPISLNLINDYIFVKLCITVTLVQTNLSKLSFSSHIHIIDLISKVEQSGTKWNKVVGWQYLYRKQVNKLTVHSVKYH